MYRFKTFSTLPKEFGSLPFPVKRLSLFIFIYSLSWSIFIPFESIYLNDTFGNYSSAAWIVGSLYFFMAFLAIPIGELTEFINTRKILFVTLIFYLPVGPAMLFLQSITQFFIFKIYHAILATLLWITCYVYIRQRSPEQKNAEVIGFFNASWGVSAIIGSLIGGVVAFFYGDIRILLLLMPLFILPSLVFALFLPNHQYIKNKPNLFIEIKKIFKFSHIKNNAYDFFKTDHLAFFALVAFLITAASSSVALTLPLFSIFLNANYFQVAAILALSTVPMLFQAPFAIIADKYGKKKIMKIGFLISGIIFLALLFTNSIVMLGILAFLLSVSFSISTPAIEGELTKLMPYDKKGKFGGITEFAIHLGAACGMFIIGPIADKFGLKSAFLLGLFIMILLLTILSLKNREASSSAELNLTKMP